MSDEQIADKLNDFPKEFPRNVQSPEDELNSSHGGDKYFPFHKIFGPYEQY